MLLMFTRMRSAAAFNKHASESTGNSRCLDTTVGHANSKLADHCHTPAASVCCMLMFTMWDAALAVKAALNMQGLAATGSTLQTQCTQQQHQNHHNIKT
jgi:hypothetical protein